MTDENVKNKKQNTALKKRLLIVKTKLNNRSNFVKGIKLDLAINCKELLTMKLHL